MSTRKTLIFTLTAATLAGTALTGAAFARGGPDGDKRAMIFQELDANGDGMITEAEMAASAEARFNEADANGDGNLTAEEMIAHAEQKFQENAGKRSERMAERTARMIEKRDTDGNGALSLEEMKAGPDRAARFFEHLDTDGDGSVSLAEFEAGKGRMGKRAHKN